MTWRIHTAPVVGLLLAIFPSTGLAQDGARIYKRFDQDPNLNNLVHAAGYETCELGSLGRIRQAGSGPRDMVLIAGAGFGDDIFDRFMQSRTERYTMHAITLPGFGGTKAPPMPEQGTSYGDATWTTAATDAVSRLIRERELERPIIVAHWTVATQIALRLAIDEPASIGPVVIISGVACNGQPNLSPGDPLERRVPTVDRGYALQWFRTVTRDTWDDNNYYPHDYSKHPVRALQLWRQAADAELPVWVRYLCETMAQDLTLEFERIGVPTLILKPGFDEDLPVTEGQEYMRWFCHDSWEGVEARNDLVTVRTIDDTRVFIMDDQPDELDRTIWEFLEGLDS